ncbi:MAG: hypothetical protein JSR66_26180 [Proteobacteria bacterium]|nr:hypothetical protein [Pseudomonadota bacterium]
MSTRKPNLPLWYVEESPALWLRAVTATSDRHAAALCKRQWRDAVVAQASAATHGRLN